VHRCFAFSLLLLASGCRDKLHSTEGELRLGSTRVDFPRAFVGQTQHAQLEVSNTWLSQRELTTQTQAPFGSEQMITLAGATTLALELTFSPTDAGFYQGTLQLDLEGQQLEAELTGQADPWPDCQSATPCRTSRFDLASGACLETPANEGVDCTQSNACYAQAHCVAGDCVGTAVDCDDHDACSTDVCDALRGCVHFAATARCPAPPDDCHVSACDPAVGCTFAAAPDGTRCGPSDCSTASVCILGQCKRLPVSEGAPCGDPSPCQPLGRCVANVCERSPPTGLTTAWTHWAAPGAHVDWDAIADPDNNVYWRERAPDDTSSQLVSFTNDGRSRYAQPLDAPVQVALIDGVMVVSRFSSVEGRRLTDGVSQWSVDFANADVLSNVRTLSRGLGGSLYVGYSRQDGGMLLGSTVASLNVFNGTTLWQMQLPGQDLEAQTMPVDESGYSYAGTWEPTAMQHRYLAFNPSGALRWSFPNPHASPAAVFGGRVYHWDHWISETSDGGFVNFEPPTLATSGYPRLALGAISYVGSSYLDGGACGAPDQMAQVMTLVRVDPASSMVKWKLEIAKPDAGGLGITNPVLTSRSTVVFSQSTDYCGRQPYVLREVSASGEPGFSCALPGPESYFGEGLLAGDKWIAAIRSVDAGQEGVRAIVLPPGFELPEHGWATAWGSSARDNHAR
jgi:outer membrane protein assembly factor BamB